MGTHRNGKVRAVLASAVAVGAMLLIAGPAPAETLYVDDDAPPGGDGLAWPTAFCCLQDALYLAASAPGSITEIRVGQGVYQPDQDEGSHVTPGDRAATFHLISDLALLGGYAGYGAPDPDDRDIALYEAILTGDLVGDDEPGFVNYEDNSCHVISFMHDAGDMSSLDGLTITAGNANGIPDGDPCGAGVRGEGGEVLIIQCSLRSNKAGAQTDGSGGGVWLDTVTATFVDCTFEDNLAIEAGGAIAAVKCDLTLDGCSFFANAVLSSWWGAHGGAVYAKSYGSGSVDASNCFFAGNTAVEDPPDASRGGAAYLAVDSTITDCGFDSNESGGLGGALSLEFGKDFLLEGCQFEGNHAFSTGGAVYGCGDLELYTDCDFVFNYAEMAGGAIRTSADVIDLAGCVMIYNTAESTGGGLSAQFADFVTVSDCFFTGNRAEFGGAVSADEGVDLLVENVTCSGNTAWIFGGAAYLRRCTSFFSGCLIESNQALFGGGAYVDLATVDLVQCQFDSNDADLNGGGLLNYAGSIVLTDCTFKENAAEEDGGGLYNTGTSPTIASSSFVGNIASRGGGIHNLYAAPRFVNCVVEDNEATHTGAGLYNLSNDGPTFINCLFAGNHSELEGGGVYNAGGVPTFVSSTFRNSNSSLVSIEEPGAEIRNCVVWDSYGDPIIGPATVRYSCVKDGWPGEGNIGADPLFVDPGNGDLRLAAGSPCIDAADNTAVPEDIIVDLDGNPRFVDDPYTEDTGFGEPPIVDMGAYEYQPPPPECPADFDDDGDVDTADLLFLLGAWGTPDGDVDGDGDTDTSDLLDLLAAWGQCP